MSFRLRRRAFIALALAATSVGMPSVSRAANGTWSGGAADGLWTSAGNWDVIADGSGNTADFNSVDITADTTVTLNADRTIGNLIFGDLDPTISPAGWIIAAGNTLTLAGATPTVTVNALGGTSNVTISAPIAGLSGLAKTGAGTLVLSGANTYSGATTVDSGTLTVSSTGLLGAGGLSFTNSGSTAAINLNSSQSITSLSAVNSGASGNILTLASGTTLSLNQTSNSTFGAILAGSGAINKTGSGTLTLNQINTYTGTITLNGGGLTLDMSGSNFTTTSQLSLPTGAKIAVGGSTLTYKINTLSAVQEQTNFVVNSGSSTLTSTRGSGGRIVAKLGGPVRNIGGTVNISNITSNANDWRTPVTTNVNGVTPWLTVLGNDFFAANASGLSGNGAAYTAYTSSTATTLGTSTQNVTVVTDVAVPAASTINTLRFNDSANSRTLTIGAGDTLNIGTGAILVSNNVANHRSRITGGSIAGGNPGSSSGADLIILQNLNPSAGANAEFVIDSTIVDSSGGATALTKSGIGLVRITNTANTYTGKTFLNGGTTRISGEGATLGSLGTIPGSVVSDAVTFNGGTLQLAASLDLNANRGITINQNGATIDTNTFNSTYSGSIVGVGGLTKSSSGTLNLQGNNTYSGVTTVSGGTLAVNNTTGSGTGSGAISIASGATLTGAGSMTGTVTTVSGSSLAPGNNGIGTMTIGGLTMATGSVFNFELPSSGSTADLVNVTGNNAFTLNGGSLNLYANGTTSQFTHSGVYKLFQYSGALQGTGIGALSTSSVLNPVGGLTYAFDTTTNPGFITLTIGGSVATIAQWVVDADGNWSTASNWTPGVPQNAGDTANFTTTLATVGRTVTLDGAQSVGSISFNSGSTNGYSIAPGTGSLTIDNGGSSASITVDNAAGTTATHAIGVPAVLNSNVNVSVNNSAANVLAITGNLSGSGKITKTGPGVLALSGTNSYGPAAGTVGTTLNAGTIQVSGNSPLGAGDVSITSSATIQAGANATLANNVSLAAGVTGAFDTQANSLTISGVISQTAAAAALTKSGSGNLTLTNDNTYTGATTVSAGTLTLGNGGSTGSVAGSISNSGALVLNHAGPYTFGTAVSGSGTLTSSGTGTTTISGANTFSGDTAVTAGTLELGAATALQNSTLNYNNQGGVFSFGTQTAATLGGLKGAQNLALANTTPAAVALTVGGNNQDTTYSGNLSDAGSVVKMGTGILTLTGTNTYTGGTTVAQGKITVGAGGSVTGANFDITPTTGSSFATIIVDGGTLTSTATSTFKNGSTSQIGGQFFLNSGSATFANLNLSTDNSANVTNTGLWKVLGGTLTANNVVIGRNGISFTTEPTGSDNSRGFIMTGGTVNFNGSLTMGLNNSTNSTVQLNLTGGNMTVAGAIQLGLNNAGRWSVIDVNGATFNSTNSTSGLTLVTPTTTPGSAELLVRNGTANVAKLTLGDPAVTAVATALVNVPGGTLNVGSGGISAGSASTTNLVRLGNGVLGASANWTLGAGVSVNLGGPIASAPITATIRADDGATTPVAHNIVINGVISDAPLSATITPAVGLNKTGAGTLTFGANNTFTGATNVNAGTLAYGASQTNVTGGINVASGATAGIVAAGDTSGLINPQPALVTGAGDPSGYVPGDKYVITSNVTVAAGGKFDVNDGILVINSGTFSAVNAAVHAGRIFSSTAQYDASTLLGLTGLGMGDNFDLSYAGIAANNQLTITGSLIPAASDFGQQFIFKYTYIGDANLDGKVTTSDYDFVFGNLGSTTNGVTGNPVIWGDGDFNGNGVVDTTDLDNLFANLGFGTTGNVQPPLLPGTSVPEPSSVALLLLGLAGSAAVIRRKK